MAVQFDDQGLRLIGLGERHIDFYDDDGDVRASIYLDEHGKLNIGGIQLSTSDGGEGSTVDLASVPFLAIAANDLLEHERVFVAGDGLQATDEGGGNNYTLRLGTPGTLSAQSAAAVTAASHTHPITASSNPGSNEFILKSTAAGALTLQQLNVDNIRLDGNTLSAQSGDLTLGAAGGDVVLPSAINIGADNFVSQLTGWRVDYDGSADFRSIYADELHVRAFIADIEQALAGGQIISKSVALLSRDFRVPFHGAIVTVNSTSQYITVAGDKTGNISVNQGFEIAGTVSNNGSYSVASTQYVAPNTRIFPNEALVATEAGVGEVRFRRTLHVEDLPGFENTGAFASGDWLRLRVIDRSGGGLVVADVWGTVSSYSDLSGGEQSWNFTCRDDGQLDGRTVYAGAIALDYGTSGDGYHEVTALDSDGPYSQIVTWETDPTNSANYTLRSRLGNLDGVTDPDFPSIGGWGLYSTQAFLKGDLIAADGIVTIDDDGISIEAATSWADKNAVTWYTPGGTVIGTIYGEQGGGNPEFLELWGCDPEGSEIGPRITLNHPGVVGGNGSIALVASTITAIQQEVTHIGVLYMDSSSVRTGIVTQSPDFTLDVEWNVADYLARFFNDGNNNNRNGLIIQGGADANPSHVAITFRDGDGNGIGTIVGNGSGGVTYNTTSDERTKQDIEALQGALGKVLALRPITYRGKGAARDGAKRPGLVAQAVRGVIPEVVTEGEGGLLGLDYMGLVPYLIGAVQDLHTRIEALEAR